LLRVQPIEFKAFRVTELSRTLHRPIVVDSFVAGA
jgi:hypothetical protein